MSSGEYHKGKLVKIEQLSNKPLSEAINYLLDNFDIIDYDLEDNYICSKYVCMLGNDYYKMDDKELDDYFCEYHVNADNSIDYFVSFHNGGTPLEEVLFDIVDEIAKNNNTTLSTFASFRQSCDTLETLVFDNQQQIIEDICEYAIDLLSVSFSTNSIQFIFMLEDGQHIATHCDYTQLFKILGLK